MKKNRKNSLTVNNWFGVSNEKIDYQFGIIVVGDSNTGKTCLSRVFVDDEFDNFEKATIAVDCFYKLMEYENDRCIHMLIKDTAGQERFKSIIPSFYKDCVGAIVVFDLTNKKTFDNIAYWLNQIIQHMSHVDYKIPVVIVGCKCDEVNKRVVEFSDVDRFINHEFKDNKAVIDCIYYYETSAKHKINVNQPFELLINYILENKDSLPIKIVNEKKKNTDINSTNKKHQIVTLENKNQQKKLQHPPDCSNCN